LGDKANWHREFNKGFVPILEVPNGTLIPESGIAVEYALQAGQGQGIELIPQDPVTAALMRVKMAKFDPTLGMMFAPYMTRYADPEAMQKMVNAVQIWESWVAEAGEGKYLMGTDEITLLDIYCGAFWDGLFAQANAETWSQEFAPYDLKNKFPLWWAYMERIREHPKLKPHRFNHQACNKWATRAKVFEVGKKCQLSVSDVLGCFDDI